MGGSTIDSWGPALGGGLRRRLVLVAALTVTGAGLGTVLGLIQSQTATAESSILVSPLEGNPFSPTSDDLINLETEAQLGRSVAFAQAVADAADVPNVGLLSNLSVSVPPITQMLSITYSATSTAQAVQLAQALADQYLEYRQERGESVAQDRSERIEDQIDAQNESLSELVDDLNDAPEPGQRTVLRAQVSGVSAQIAQLRTQLDEVRTGAIDPGQLIAPAVISSPSPVVVTGGFGLTGGLAGLMLAIAFVILRVRAQNTLQLAEDVETSGLVLLADLGQTDVEASVEQAFDRQGAGEIGPGLRELRVALLSRAPRRPLRILLGTSAAEETGPRSAIGLAYAAAASGYRTLLVDAIREGEGITQRFELTGCPGFNDVLAGTVSVDEALVTVADHLQVLPAGDPHPRSEDNLTGPGIATVSERLGGLADITIVATGSMLEAWSQALVLVSDVTVVEAVQGLSGVDELVEITNDLSPAPVLGVVFVRPPGRSTSKKTRRTPPHHVAGSDGAGFRAAVDANT